MSTGKTYSTKYLLDSNNNRGAEGQVLSTTSTGIDWVDSGTLSTGLWLKNGNNIYNSNSGSVGIGITSLSDWGWIIDHALQFANGAFVAGRTDSTAAINLGSNAFVTATGGYAWKYFAAGAATRYIQQVGEHYFQVAGVGAAAGDTITWSTALNILNNGNSIFTNSVSIGTTVSPTRTLDVRGTGLNIFGSGGNTELMLRGQVEGTGTVRDLGAWHLSVRSDVGGDNDDLKLLRFETGSYRGTAMQISNSTGNIGIGVNTIPNADYRLILEDTNEDILRLHNSTDGLDALISFTNPGGTLARIQGIDNGGLGFDVGNNAGGIISNAMFVKNTGNVGIGTDDPSSKLHVRTSTDHNFEFEETGGELRISALNNARDANIPLQFAASQFNFITGNVGIGSTTLPSFPLEVENASTAYIFSETTGAAASSGYRWKTPDSEFAWFSTGGINAMALYDYVASAERMRIDSTGQLMVGTTTPRGFTTIEQGDVNTVGLVVNSTSATYSPKLYLRDQGGAGFSEIQANNDLYINAANVGIGTDNPGAKLEVNGAANIKGTTNFAPVLTLGTAGAINAVINSADEMFFNIDSDNNQTSAAFWFGHNSTQGDTASNLMIIKDSGNVGIGTTSPLSLSANTSSLSVNSTRTDLSGGLFLKANDVSKVQLYWSTTGFINEIVSGTVDWYTNNALKMQLLSGDTGQLTLKAKQGTYSQPAILRLEGTNNNSFGGSVIADSTITSSTDGTAYGANLTFGVNDTSNVVQERMRIDSSGNVGIGTTSPSAKLEVRGTAPTYTDSSTVFWGGTTNNDSHNGIMLSSLGDALGGSLASNLLYSNSNTPTQTNTNRSSGQIKFENTTIASKTSDINFGGYYKGTTTFIERMRIDSSGNVGINVTNPNEKLHVDGNIRLDGSVFFSSSSVSNKILLNGTDMEIWSGALFPSIDITSAGLLKFGAYALSGAGTPTKLLGVDSSGNVLTTVSGGDLPGGPYLPLAGGTITGNLGVGYAVQSNIRTFIYENSSNYTLAVQQDGTGVPFQVTSGGSVRLIVANGGNVGIGTTTPSTKLDVRGGAGGGSFDHATFTSVTSRGLKISTANSSEGQNGAAVIYNAQDGQNYGSHAFQVGGSTKMFIKGNNVGIGTTSPTNLLTINDPNANGSITDTIPSWWGLVVDRAYSTSSSAAIAVIGGTVATGSSGRLYLGNSDDVDNSFIDGGANRLYFSVGGEKMRITSAGNVGIGTTGPDALLSLGPTAGQKFYVYSDGSTVKAGIGVDLSGSSRELSIFNSSSNGYSDGNISFGYRNESNGAYQERMRLTSGGNLGIGTTSPDEKLDITGGYLKFNGGDYGIKGSASLTYNPVSDHYFMSSGSTKVTIKASGNVGIGVTNPGQKLSVHGNIELVGEDVGNCGVRYIKYNCPDDASYNVLGLTTSTANFITKVGINKTSPAVKLDVSDSIAGSGFTNGLARFENTIETSSWWSWSIKCS